MSFCRVRASALLLFLAAAVAPPFALADQALSPQMRAQLAARPSAPTPLAPRHFTACVDGMADIYPCSNIDLLAFVPVSEFSSVSTNSLWGWTDTLSGIEYALIGADNGVVFYALDPADHPRYLGKLPTHAGTGSSLWRDVRVYADHAFVVSDNNPGHGMQVFDLTRLRGVTTPQTFTEDGHYGAFGSGHTISVNEDTGFAYVPGTNLTCPGDSDHGGLQMLDIHVPATPTFAGCVGDAGYTHESQCWIYNGPDTEHVGREICVDANGPSRRVAIVDVTDKNAPDTLSSSQYTGSSYPHQGWLTDDHRYLLVNDELDETGFGHTAWTYIWDVSDLDLPVLVGHHDHGISVIDHNLYVHGQYVYASNYEAGLRILRMDNLSNAQLTEVAFFDTYPNSNNASFNGSWNNYRFPGSGNVIVSGIDEGFFVVAPRLCTPPPIPTGLVASANGDNQIDLVWNAGGAGDRYRVERAQGGCSGNFETIADDLAAATYSDTDVSGQVDFGYRIVASDGTGECAAEASACAVAQTTGACTAPPLFTGVSAVTNAATDECRVDLAWNAAQAACGGPANYSVYRSDIADFTPDSSNRIAQSLIDLAYSDGVVSGDATQFYVVRSSDSANSSEDHNLVRLSVLPTGPNSDGTFGSGAEPGDPVFEAEGVIDPLDERRPDDVQHAGWHHSITRVHTGTQSFWSTAANNLCVTLVTPPLQLTAGETSSLSFWTAWDVEAGWDGGVIEVSTDDGLNWSRLTPAGGYPGTINDGGTLCGVAEGDGAFTGEGNLAWSEKQVDLSAYAGESVKLRWLYRTDGKVTEEGWYVDDVAITHAQVPGMCTIAGDGIFEDGFESPVP